MIEIAGEALRNILDIVTRDDRTFEAGTVSERQVRYVEREIEKTSDGPFVQLALEQILKDGSEADWGHVAPEYEDNMAGPLRDLYMKLFGALPSGPAPRVKYVSVWHSGLGKTYQHEYWVAVRDNLYGPPPYDYDLLRAQAMS